MTAELLEDAFQDVVTPELVERLSAKSTDFTTLVSKLGLDPMNDFRHADLVGVDFSNSDLNAFDFTGADLRQSFGVAVRWHGAKLTGARIEGSLFEYHRQRSEFFSQNPEAERLLQSLSSEHWTNATLWVAETLRRRKRRDLIAVAEALFLDTKDGFLRNEILPYLARGFEDRTGYLSFLLETLASRGDNPSIKRSVVRAAGRMFFNQRSVFELLKRELESDALRDPSEIIFALARSRWTLEEFDEVSGLIRRKVDDHGRKLFVRSIARFHAGAPAYMLSDRKLGPSLDYGAFISDEMIRSAAWLNAPLAISSAVYVDEAARRTVFIRQSLQRLSQLGLDLRIEPAKEREAIRREKRKEPFRVPEGRRILEG